ncbi:unnamed protein product, partial [marine sediment metagenome]
MDRMTEKNLMDQNLWPAKKFFYGPTEISFSTSGQNYDCLNKSLCLVKLEQVVNMNKNELWENYKNTM